MGRVMRELRTSTGDAATDKARMRVINRDADNIIGTPVLEHEDNTRFGGPLYIVTCSPFHPRLAERRMRAGSTRNSALHENDRECEEQRVACKPKMRVESE